MVTFSDSVHTSAAFFQGICSSPYVYLKGLPQAMSENPEEYLVLNQSFLWLTYCYLLGGWPYCLACPHPTSPLLSRGSSPLPLTQEPQLTHTASVLGAHFVAQEVVRRGPSRSLILLLS